jgi:dipeptidyl aminopeptidase/acylaminoacyl peptidase
MNRTLVRYGSHRAQVAEIWRPPGAVSDHPVVVLIHGGFWRQIYTRRLMHRMARAIAAHGWVGYNIEYRRVGRFGSGGWPETFDDVRGALDALAGVDGVDRERIVTCGHSAGGHLALWAGSGRTSGTASRAQSDEVRVHTAISLAGVVDLAAAARHRIGGNAVVDLMGGGPDEVPGRYALGSPAEFMPSETRQVLVHGLDDTTVPHTLSKDYVELMRTRGGDARYVPLAGVAHMEMIDPGGAAFPEVLACLDEIAAP